MRFKDNSPQAVKLPPRMDTKTARAVMDETGVPFSCTPEELAARLTRALRWYAIDQQQSEALARMAHSKSPLRPNRQREFIEIPAEALRPRPIRRVPGTEEEERELLKVLNSGPTPYDPETSGYDWWSPATECMDAPEREALGILNAKPDAKTKIRARRLLDKTPKDKGGGPENVAVTCLVLRLADIYKECTGRGLSHPLLNFGRWRAP